jgi:hypothetical protein
MTLLQFFQAVAQLSGGLFVVPACWPWAEPDYGVDPPAIKKHPLGGHGTAGNPQERRSCLS